MHLAKYLTGTQIRHGSTDANVRQLNTRGRPVLLLL